MDFIAFFYEGLARQLHNEITPQIRESNLGNLWEEARICLADYVVIQTGFRFQIRATLNQDQWIL